MRAINLHEGGAMTRKTALILALLLGASGLWAQDPQNQQSDPQPTQQQPALELEEDAPITGGVVYQPETPRSDDEKLRDPFKSPFEIEKEEREKEKTGGIGLGDMESRLSYSISELNLKGIYLAPQSGYVAIFSIGDDYKWFKVGEKFRDGDLVNITDGAVVFKYYPSDDVTQVREVVKELHRGEEY